MQTNQITPTVSTKIAKMRLSQLFLAFATLFVLLTFASSADAQATFTVTNTADNGVGSLRNAVLLANSAVTNDTINFNISLTDGGCVNGVCTVTLTTGDLSINTAGTFGTLTIVGTGANVLRISGNDNSRIFFVDDGSNLSISGLSLINGNSRGTLFGMRGGAICNFGTLTVMSSNISNNIAIENGGGIYNENGTVIVRNTTFDSNSVTGNTGIGGGGGGGFYTNFGTFELTGSTVSNNTVMNFGGGIFLINGTVTINNSTISGNSANGIEGASGGIENMNATLNVSNSTITNNRAINDSINNGGGIWSNSATTISNTIVAGNSVVNTDSAPDIRVVRGMFVSSGNNLIGNTSNMGAAIAFQSTDIINQNPRLTPLGNFGGTTKTHALFVNSPAIDTGNALITTDQRGMMRPIDNPNVTNILNGSDIGAFEASLNPTAARVSVSGKVTSSNGRGISKTIISMMDENGNIRRATTSFQGIYNFDDVTISGNKIFTVTNKRFSFTDTSIVRSIIEDTDDVNFTARPR